jgi:D-alanine-D-alanine ligase
MHKSVTKEVVSNWGVPTLPSVLIKRGEPFSPRTIVTNLGTSLIVKPDDGGSSVGVFPLAEVTGGELREAVDKAFNFTNRVLIEPLLTKMDEVECGVISHQGGYLSSPPGLVINPLAEEKFLTYNQKYLSSNQAYIEVPAPIGEEKQQEISNLAIMVAQALSVGGYARVDFFLEEGGRVWFNEINTLPGLTASSHFPLLIEAIAYPWERLIPHLIKEALEAASHRSSLNLYGEE